MDSPEEAPADQGDDYEEIDYKICGELGKAPFDDMHAQTRKTER